MQYQKVKIQPNDIGDAEWLPYSKRTFKMGYSKKIDVYLLFEGGTGSLQWVKTYNGISYKKMKKILGKPYIQPFALIKDKKGRITKIVELFVS